MTWIWARIDRKMGWLEYEIVENVALEDESDGKYVTAIWLMRGAIAYVGSALGGHSAAPDLPRFLISHCLRPAPSSLTPLPPNHKTNFTTSRQLPIPKSRPASSSRAMAAPNSPILAQQDEPSPSTHTQRPCPMRHSPNFPIFTC